jgi:TonB family protein
VIGLLAFPVYSVPGINPGPAMKTTAIPLIFMLAFLPAMQGAFESVAIEVTVEPQIPALLRMQGLRYGTGHVAVALSVGADGRLADTLVLSATQQELVPSVLESIKEWRFKPARYDGQAVPVTFELVINFTQTGVVINQTPVEMLNAYMERLMNQADYAVCPATEMDRPLVTLKQVNPNYALTAQKQGISGRVRVNFYVDEAGNVRMPAVTADTHPYLSACAIDALRNWKFSPPTRNGRPVIIAAAQEFAFGVIP